MRVFAISYLILGFIGKTLWPSQLGETELLSSFIVFVVNLIVLTIVFYVVGRVVVGKKRAKFGDAFVISLFGTLTGTILSLFIPHWLGAILSLIVWLLLIRHFYETGWVGALAVGILAVIVMIVLGFILEILLAALELILPHLP